MKDDSARRDYDAAVGHAMRDLENDICCLLSMARILGDLLDDNLVAFEGRNKIHRPKPGETMVVHLHESQMDSLCFAWNDVINRAADLRSKFYLALQEGVAQ